MLSFSNQSLDVGFGMLKKNSILCGQDIIDILFGNFL
jgi:hypothetical protein